MGFIYLLHFDKPLKHAAHYIGWAEKDLEGRIQAHRTNTSDVKLIQEAHKENTEFTFQVARIWTDKTRKDERKLKNQGGASRVCPICKALKQKKQ